jgi:hypothetical protein
MTDPILNLQNPLHHMNYSIGYKTNALLDGERWSLSWSVWFGINKTCDQHIFKHLIVDLLPFGQKDFQRPDAIAPDPIVNRTIVKTIIRPAFKSQLGSCQLDPSVDHLIMDLGSMVRSYTFKR